MIHEDTFRPVSFSGAKGLVFIGDRVLAMRRDHKTRNAPGLLDLPGGGREEGETPFETFKREAWEEFGVKIEKDDIVASFRQESIVNPGTKSFFMVTRPLRLSAEDVTFGNEGLEWFLMDPKEFASRPDGIARQQKKVTSYLAGTLAHE